MSRRERMRQRMEGLRGSIKAGVHAVSAPSLFPTPDALAARVATALETYPQCSVLEPSAGTGQLVRAVERVRRSAKVTAIERDYRLAAALGVEPRDFLAVPAYGDDFEPFDRVAMNPPFDRGADIVHIRHALKFLRFGGVLVAICANGPRQREAFLPIFDLLEELPAGTFQGTKARAMLIRYRYVR